MSQYIDRGGDLYPTDNIDATYKKKLPLGTYVMKLSLSGFYLEPMSDFKSSGKIYGDTLRRADRIIATYKDRAATTGVLLEGEKGSGKTLLAKVISERGALAEGMSTIVINNDFVGDDFSQMIQSIDEPCMLIFDEFEKVYSKEKQESILTLLDGVFTSKKLIVFTVNDKYNVNQHMINRPGRIFYMLNFTGLEKEFIQGYCEDNLKNKSYIEQICKLTLMFDNFNFDMLKALVEEMNRYNESPAQALEMLNAKPMPDRTDYDVTVKRNGVELTEKEFSPLSWSGNPLVAENIQVELLDLAEVPEGETAELWNMSEGDAGYSLINFTAHELKSMDSSNKSFTFALIDDKVGPIEVTFKREVIKAYNWRNSLA